ncbi:MAG: hypothetical protein EOO77_42570 [Oxalobacteraceae bacterium]|nr:MAG: hypothetical protein EOO77_42570 [Oxalobacteraceae bacterium]
MRYHQLLSEAALQRDLVLYHGSDSGPFDSFAPGSAAKGEQLWNPLGNGMYATDSIRFARRFGKQIHKVVIPAGASFRRITNAEWASRVGRGIIYRAIKMAFDERGRNYTAWAKGNAKDLDLDPASMNTKTIIDTYHKLFVPLLPRPESVSKEDLAAMKKAIIAKSPRSDSDSGYTRAAIEEFKKAMDRHLTLRTSPYQCMKDSVDVVRNTFGAYMGKLYMDALPQVSQSVLGKYDLVVFTDTADFDRMGRDGRSSQEIVIFNPAFQKAQPLSMEDRISAMSA